MARRSPLLAAAVLLLAGCGGDDDAAPVDRPAVADEPADAAGAGDAPTGDDSAGEPSGDQAPTDPVVCHVPAPTEIGRDEPITGETTAGAPTLCYWVDVPAGLTSVEFSLGDLAADLSLEVTYGFARNALYNTGEYWSSRNEATTAESILITEPRSGPYFVKVGPATRDDLTTFSLLVTTDPASPAGPTGAALPAPDTCGGPVTILTIGDSFPDQVVASDRDPGPRAYYCVEVPAGTPSLTVELAGLSGHLDLRIQRVGSGELWSDLSRGTDTRTVVIDSPLRTAYYIEVAPALPGAGSTYTITVS